MAEIKFFKGKSLSYERVLEEEVINLNFNVGLHGSIDGEAEIEVTPENIIFISSLKKNSHFIKIKKNSNHYGALISSVFINNSIATINFIGFYEYMEMVIAISSGKASITGTSAIQETDQSWVENYYADTPLGLFYGILRNNQEVMEARGYSVNYDISQLIPYITMNSNSEWSRSYRVNSLEAKALKSIINDILNDVEIEGIEFYVDGSNTFKWFIKPITSYEIVEINEAEDDVFNLEFGEDDSKSASYSVLTGTALNGDDLISTLPFNDDLAYSTFVVENPVERTSEIGRLNTQGQLNEENKGGQLSFSTYTDDIKLLSQVTISSPKLGDHTGIVNEYIIEGREVRYTMQLITGVVKTGGLRKPTNVGRKIMFNPLNYSVNTTRGQVFKKNQAPTGWR